MIGVNAPSGHDSLDTYHIPGGAFAFVEDAMTDRRTFNQRERAALFLAADGKCEQCGTPLAAGWHADHIAPYSKGGPTAIENGQALCADCNLRKGSTGDMGQHQLPEKFVPREWQVDALSQYDKVSAGCSGVATICQRGAARVRL